LFDSEIVCLDDAGKPVFQDVVHRMQQTGKGAVDRARARHPAVCYIFDCLYLDGRPIVNEPLFRRRVWMEDAIRHGTPYRVSEEVADGVGLFRAAREMGLEGIMAKESNGTYKPGMRSPQWLKIKKRQTAECVIIGYTRGKGGRAALFGALQLAFQSGSGLRYAGKVGTGFDEKSSKEVFSRLKDMKPVKRPVSMTLPENAETVWVEPGAICEVQYASLTRDGMLREPVFLRLRPDLAV
jgi:ATP-dependent DNA ligase